MKFACLVAMVKFTAWARRASRRLFGRALNRVEISRGIVHVLLNCFLHGGCDDSLSAFSTSIHLTFYWMDQTSIQQVSSTPEQVSQHAQPPAWSLSRAAQGFFCLDSG